MTYDLKVIEVTVVPIYGTYLFSTCRYEQHANQFFFKSWKTHLFFGDIHVLKVTGVSQVLLCGVITV